MYGIIGWSVWYGGKFRRRTVHISPPCLVLAAPYADLTFRVTSSLTYVSELIIDSLADTSKPGLTQYTHTLLTGSIVIGHPRI